MDECECRPLGFLIALPFVLIALVFSLLGAVVWLLGRILSCFCPCCMCCDGLADMAMSLLKLPLKVFRWIAKQIPC